MHISIAVMTFADGSANLPDHHVDYKCLTKCNPHSTLHNKYQVKYYSIDINNTNFYIGS